jgi:dihydroorotase
MGVVGLECAFAVLHTALVLTGIIPISRLIEVMSLAPRRIFGLGGGALCEGAVADLTVIDTERHTIIDPEQFFSMGRSTPFAGMQVQGDVVMTLVDGRIVYLDETSKNKICISE